MDDTIVAPPKLGWENDVDTFSPFEGEKSITQRTVQVIGSVLDEHKVEKKIVPTRDPQWVHQDLTGPSTNEGELTLLRVRRKRCENPLETVVLGPAVTPRIKRTRAIDDAAAALEATHLHEGAASAQFDFKNNVSPQKESVRSVYRRVGTLPAIRIVGVKTDEQIEQDKYNSSLQSMQNQLMTGAMTKEEFDRTHEMLVRKRYLSSSTAAPFSSSPSSSPSDDFQGYKRDFSSSGMNPTAPSTQTTESTSSTQKGPSIQFIDALPSQQVSQLRKSAQKDSNKSKTSVGSDEGIGSSYSSVYQQMDTRDEIKRAKAFAKAEARRLRKAQQRFRSPTLPEDADSSEDEIENDSEDENEDEATHLRKVLRKLADKNIPVAIKAPSKKKVLRYPMDSYTNHFFARKRVESQTNTSNEQNYIMDGNLALAKMHQDSQIGTGLNEDNELSENSIAKQKRDEEKKERMENDGEFEDEEEAYDLYELVSQEEVKDEAINQGYSMSLDSDDGIRGSRSRRSGSSNKVGMQDDPVSVTVLNSEEVENLLQYHSNWAYEDDAIESDVNVYDDLDDSESEIDYPDSESSEEDEDGSSSEDDDDDNNYKDEGDSSDLDYYERSKRGGHQRQKLHKAITFGYAGDGDEDEDRYNEMYGDHRHANGEEDDEDEEEGDLHNYQHYMEQNASMVSKARSKKHAQSQFGFDRFGRLSLKEGDKDFSRISSWEKAMASKFNKTATRGSALPIEHDFEEEE